jgi:hypothetical protein
MPDVRLPQGNESTANDSRRHTVETGLEPVHLWPESAVRVAPDPGRRWESSPNPYCEAIWGAADERDGENDGEDKEHRCVLLGGTLDGVGFGSYVGGSVTHDSGRILVGVVGEARPIFLSGARIPPYLTCL